MPSEPVEAGKQIVPFDPDQETLQDTAIESEIAKQLQAILKSVGLADDFAVKTVARVGSARRDTAGNVYITPPENAAKVTQLQPLAAYNRQLKSYRCL